MSPKSILALFVCVGLFALLALSGCVAAPAPPAVSEAQATTIVAPEPPIDELIAQEKAKWDELKTGSMAGFASMVADDFVSVQYSPLDGALSRVGKSAVTDSPSFPPAEFETSDYQVVKASPEAVVLSYRVTGISVPFDAYATTVWALRDGEWLSVFYQASPFPPPAGSAVEGASEVPDAGDAAAQPAGSQADLAQWAGRYLASYTSGTVTVRDALLLKRDGSYAVDARATGQYGTTGRFSIEGNLITLTDDERTDVPVCTGDQRSATYEVTRSGASFTLHNVDDRCVGRIGYFADREWTRQ